MTVYLYYLGVCVLGEGGGGASSLFRRRIVGLKLLQSIHIKVKSENMTQNFDLYDGISFSNLP